VLGAHAHARDDARRTARRAPTRRRTARRDRPRSAGPRAVAPHTCTAPPCFPCSHSPRVLAAPPDLWPRHRTLAYTHARCGRVTAHAPLVLPRPSPWCARKHPTASRLAYKSISPSFARGNIASPSRHCRPPVLTVSSTLRPLAPPTRVAPACPRVPSSSPVRLLFCPSRQLAGVIPPAAAAVGAGRTRPPAVSPP
jgi:hypothetical protein